MGRKQQVLVVVVSLGAIALMTRNVILASKEVIATMSYINQYVTDRANMGGTTIKWVFIYSKYLSEKGLKMEGKLEEYHGKVRKGLNSVKVTIIDDSGLLKFQDDVTIVIHHNGEAILLVDYKKAIERQKKDRDMKLNTPLP